MDVKNELNFEEYYRSEYSNVISHYYEMLKGKKISAIVKIFILAIIVSFIPIIFSDILKEVLQMFYSTYLTLYYVAIIIGFAVAIIYSLNNKMYEIKEYIIKDLISYISNNEINEIKYEPKMQVTKESLGKMNLFNLDVVKYRGKNYIKANYNKNNMVFSDMNIYVYDIIEEQKEVYKNGKKYIRTIKKKKKRDIFDGLYIGATMNKKNSNQIYLIPNNFKDTFLQSKIMSYIGYHGTNVMLENLEFSKKYKVFCDDEVQARYILSLGLMEKINQIDELFSGKKYIVFKEGKRFAICIEGFSIEKIKKANLPIFRNQDKELKILTKMFNQLNDLFNIYHILDLGNELYTNHIDKNIDF